MTETFTCQSCGNTHEKGWSDEEAAAEAQQNFPGIDLADPDEAPVVCDSCYEHIMGRARAEAPELIGPGWRGREPEVLEDGSLLYEMTVPGGSFLAGFGKPAESPSSPGPIPDFPGFLASMLSEGFTRNPCRDNCPDKDDEHVHLRSPAGNDGIIWADGRVSEWDLTQPARLIYPAYGGGKRRPSLAASPDPGWPASCYTMSNGSPVHVRPGCRC